MSSEICIEIGKQVLKEEAQAILDLVDTINENFVNACKMLKNCKGKVILTGVGKSGHIANKIASTLASTGTQAFFVQAAEAAHGDLGMIGDNDIVIAISHSGEGSELKVMIPAIKRKNVKLISITGNSDSYLAKIADISLNASIQKEACPFNLAPTSSSTVELALGDALAISLLQMKNFTKKDFALSHPGGLLGKRLSLTCEDVMRTGKDIPMCLYNVSIKDALFEMTSKNLGIVAVCDEEKNLLGVYTDGDLRRTLELKNSLDISLEQEMTKGGVSVSAFTLAYDALAIMYKQKVSTLIVTNQNKIIGIFNMQDLLNHGIM